MLPSPPVQGGDVLLVGNVLAYGRTAPRRAVASLEQHAPSSMLMAAVPPHGGDLAHPQFAATTALATAIGFGLGLRRRRRPNRMAPVMASRGPVAPVVGSPEVQEKPPRQTIPREEPTQYPKDELFYKPLRRVLDLLKEETYDPDDFDEACYKLQEFHEWEPNWIVFPTRIVAARKTRYGRGILMFIFGIIDACNSETIVVRQAAISLLYSLMHGGSTLTKVPAVLLVECGVVAPLAKAAVEGKDSSLLAMIEFVSKNVANEVLPKVCSKGVVEGALKAANHYLTSGLSVPVDELNALSLILFFSKRMPLTAVEAGCFEAVEQLNAIEVLKANKSQVLTALLPVLKSRKSATPVTTTIQIGGYNVGGVVTRNKRGVTEINIPSMYVDGTK